MTPWPSTADPPTIIGPGTHRGPRPGQRLTTASDPPRGAPSTPARQHIPPPVPPAQPPIVAPPRPPPPPFPRPPPHPPGPMPMPMRMPSSPDQHPARGARRVRARHREPNRSVANFDAPDQHHRNRRRPPTRSDPRHHGSGSAACPLVTPATWPPAAWPRHSHCGTHTNIRLIRARHHRSPRFALSTDNARNETTPGTIQQTFTQSATSNPNIARNDPRLNGEGE